MIEIRPFVSSDFDVLCELANQAVPSVPQENAEWADARKTFDETTRFRRHHIATDAGKSVGYGCLEQQDEDEASLRIFVVASPTNLGGQVGKLLYAQLLSDAGEVEAASLWAREWLDDKVSRTFFINHGFEESRRYTVEGHPPMVVFERNLPTTD